MDIIFFGSSQFGLPSLQALIDNGHNISCVVTQPDRRKGRGLQLTKTSIKDFALKNRLNLYQPDNINTPEAINYLSGFNSQFFVVVAYGQILSKEILSIPQIMPINIHASFLPYYRGAAPINWAIINGETKTGITIIKMNEEMDAGPIIIQKVIDIKKDDNFFTMESKLSVLAKELIIESIILINSNKYALTPQDKNRISFAPKLKKSDGLINWQKNAKEIYNLIRGCLGWPQSFTYHKGKALRILKAEYNPQIDLRTNYIPGQVINISKEGIIVSAKEGNIIIKELQLEGRNRLKTPEFIAGYKIQQGEILGK